MDKEFNPQVHNRYNNDLSTEVWKPILINGEPSGYMISSFGNVKNKFGKYLSPGTVNGGYQQIMLHGVTEKGEKYDLRIYVHRLVALMFIPNPDPEKKIEVNHINFDRACNYVWNLEWVTKKENMEWSQKHGRMAGKIAFANKKFKATKWQLEAMYAMLKQGVLTDTEIAEKTGLGLGFVNSIAIGKKYIWLSQLYNYTPRDITKAVERGYYEDKYAELDRLIRTGASTNDIMDAYPLDCSREAYRKVINTRRRMLIREKKMSRVYDCHNKRLNVHFRKGAWEHKGEDCPTHKYTNEQVRKACELLQENKLTCTKIAELTGMTRHVVGQIKDGKRWTHISKDYTMPGTKAGSLPRKYHQELIDALKENDNAKAVIDPFLSNHPEVLDMMTRGKLLEKIHYFRKQIKLGKL